MYFKMFSSIICPATFSEIDAKLTGCSSPDSPSCHSRERTEACFQRIKRGLLIILVSSSALLGAYHHVPWPCTWNLNPDGLFKYSLSWSLFTDHMFSLLRTSPLISGALDSWRQIAPIRDQGKKKDITCLALFNILSHPLSCSIQHWVHMFPSLHSAAYRPLEALLVLFTLFVRQKSRYPSFYARKVFLHVYDEYFSCTAIYKSLQENSFKQSREQKQWLLFFIPILCSSVLLTRSVALIPWPWGPAAVISGGRGRSNRSSTFLW